MSTIGALAPWFGAKRTLAAKIVNSGKDGLFGGDDE